MTNLFNRNDGTFAQVAFGDLGGGAALTTVTKATTANITLTTTSYFDGPTVSQGSSGTWFASGVVTISSSGGQNVYYSKLWDGTTVIASGTNSNAGGSAFYLQIPLSGVIASPAGNLRISISNFVAGGVIIFNQSGNSADSFLTAVRIG